MSEATIRVRIRAQDEKFRQQLARANERITKLGRTSQRSGRQVRRSFRMMDRAASRFASQLGAILTGAALTSGLSRLSAMLGEVVEKLDNIGKTADALGLSTDALQEFRYGFEAAGVSITETDKSIRRFHQAIGDADVGMKTYLRHFDSLGVSLRDTNGNLKSTEALMGEVADALERTGDEAARQLAVRDLFGRSGNKLLVAFQGGAEGVANLREEVVKAGAVIEEGLIRRAEEFQTKWDLAGRVVDANMGDVANSMLELKDAMVSAKVWSSDLLADILNIFTAVENKSIRRLEEDLAEVTATIEEVREKSKGGFFSKLFDRSDVALGLVPLLERQTELSDQLTKSLEEQAAAQKAATEAQAEKIRQQAEARKAEMERLEMERETARIEAERVARIEGYRERLKTAEEKYTEAIKQLQLDRINGLITEMEYMKLAAQEYEKHMKETEEVADEASKKKQELIETLTARFESGFASLSDILERGSDAIKDTVKDLVKAVIDELWKLLVIQPIANALANAIGNFVFSGAGGAQSYHSSGVGAAGPAGVPRSETIAAPNFNAPAPVSTPAPSVAPNHPGFSTQPGAGAGGVTQINNFNTNVAATARQEIQAAMPTIVAQTEAAVRDANSRRAV